MHVAPSHACPNACAQAIGASVKWKTDMSVGLAHASWNVVIFIYLFWKIDYFRILIEKYGFF